MSDNKKDIYEGIPHELYDGEMSDLACKSEKEAVEYALKKFDAAVSKINIEIFGYDIDFPE